MKVSTVVAVGLALGTITFPGSAIAEPGSATGQGFVSAQIVKPIAVRSAADLEFGGIALSSGGGGMVTISAETGAASYSGAAKPACGGASSCSTSPARFEVSGERNRGYTIDLPTEVFARPIDGTGMQLPVSAFSSSSKHLPGIAWRGFLDHTGNDEIRIGGTLAIPAGTNPGSYRAEVRLVVSYD